MNLILIAVISLGAIALVLAAILYVASKKFAVYEVQDFINAARKELNTPSANSQK